MAIVTPKLGLPYLQVSQAQKEVTHNQALDFMDFFIQPVVVSRTATPPTGVEGNAHIIIATATGIWVGKEGQVARYINGAWSYYTPFEGLGVWSVADARDYIYHSSAWILRP